MDTGVPVMKGPGLYEFLVEAELQHYYNNIKSVLKVQSAAQLKYVTDDDLVQLGMSKPEQRRLKKFYNKHFPQNYLSKFKKLLSVKKDEGLHGSGNMSIGLYGAPDDRNGGERSQGPRVPSKHIITSDSISVNKELGIGEFGVVQQGVWTNDGERIQVAIKCLARERMQNNPIEFLKEAAIMHSIDHAHIVRLYGVVLDTDSLMLVTELAPLRSLLECLKEPALRASFPVLTLCDFAMQVCDGMQYLEAKKLIHRDLAARNILVFSKNKVKISDFGLSRALGQGKDYYQTNFNVNLKLPIAWCAPECISYLRFSTASDVWAYGVTLWEMFSYGFQPWAALTGHQILEAIDEPNYQRLEQPDCCPQDHYIVMLDCWKHESHKRPHFSEIATRLADVRPEQVQAKVTNTDASHLLPYRIGDIITVLDKTTHDQLWKGVLPNGKTGLFNPAHMVTYLGNNLPSSRPESFVRNDMKTSSKRKLRTEMISSPQGDLKHTGHVGLDGAYFGDLSFLGGSKVDYNTIPRQIVPPYKPQDDLEQAPLLCAASNVPAEHVPLPLHVSDHINIASITPPPTHTPAERRPSGKVRWQGEPIPPQLVTDHEYHEINDEENLVADSPRFEMDFGPSLMDEMESVFRNLNSPLPPPTPTSAADHEGANKCNELRELTSRLSVSSKHRKQATVKPISASDQKTLDSAIALANEISARSMNDLDTEPTPVTPASPNKRKFSFRFPNTGHHDHDSKNERRNFSDEAQSITDLQSTVTEEAQLAYESLIEAPTSDIPTQTQYTHQRHRSSQPSLPENPLRMLRSGNLPMIKPRIRTNPTALPDSRLINPLLKPKLRDKEDNTLPDRNSADFDTRFDFQNGINKRNFSNSANSISTHSEDVPDFHQSVSHDSISESTKEKSSSQETNSLHDDNPIPLPPRDRNKPMLTSKARHTRKHPLIIPASSIQRTLEKVKVVTPEENRIDPLEAHFSNNNIKVLPDGKTEPFYINQCLVGSDTSVNTPERDFDTESLHFEAQIDSNLAALDEIPNEDLDTQLSLPSNIRNSVDENILRYKPTRKVFGQVKLNAERRMCNDDKDEVDGVEKTEKYFSGSSDSMLHHNVDHVSCEDLLEFADTKPSSRARGNESDEVRIMSKVLGTEIPKEQCLLALEYSNWDVHKAIKLAKLQILVQKTPGGPFVDLATCNGALETSQWDLGRAASWIIAAHQEGGHCPSANLSQSPQESAINLSV